MRRGAVFLSPPARRVAGQAIVEMLLHQGVEPLAFSLNDVHYHLLARFGKLRARAALGRAKKHSYHVLQDWGHQGCVWARGCRPLPVRDRQHQVNVYHYIEDHVKQGAWVWTHKQGIYWETTLR